MTETSFHQQTAIFFALPWVIAGSRRKYRKEEETFGKWKHFQGTARMREKKTDVLESLLHLWEASGFLAILRFMRGNLGKSGESSDHGGIPREKLACRSQHHGDTWCSLLFLTHFLEEPGNAGKTLEFQRKARPPCSYRKRKGKSGMMLELLNHG